MILLDRDIADECAVFCETHGCVIGPHGKTGMEATELWNRRAQSPPVAQVEVYRKALESALKAFECVKANDKTVYNYKGDGAKNRDGLTLEEGRWATPLEIATDEMKLIQALLTSKPEPVAPICEKCGDKGWYYKMTGGGPGESLDKNKVECLECKPVAPVRKWKAGEVVGERRCSNPDCHTTLHVFMHNLSPEVQDALNGRKA